MHTVTVFPIKIYTMVKYNRNQFLRGLDLILHKGSVLYYFF